MNETTENCYLQKLVELGKKPTSTICVDIEIAEESFILTTA